MERPLQQPGQSSRAATSSSSSSAARPCVLFVTGWSPGPLFYLQPFLEQRVGGAALVPPPARLPMPPAEPRVWCERRYLLLTALLGLLASAGSRAMLLYRRAHGRGPGYFLCLVCVVAFLTYLVRRMVGHIVRRSVQKGVEICRELVSEHHVDVVVGFSWGGAVLAELVVQGCIGGGNHQPSALLIAPTTAAIGLIVGQPDAALRMGHAPPPGRVHVVHGTQDGFFCPHPRRWQQVPTVGFTMLHDNHVFQRPSSRQALVDLFMKLLRDSESLQES